MEHVAPTCPKRFATLVCDHRTPILCIAPALQSGLYFSILIELYNWREASKADCANLFFCLLQTSVWYYFVSLSSLLSHVILFQSFFVLLFSLSSFFESPQLPLILKLLVLFQCIRLLPCCEVSLNQSLSVVHLYSSSVSAFSLLHSPSAFIYYLHRNSLLIALLIYPKLFLPLSSNSSSPFVIIKSYS